jgi:hypothetical protein
MLARYRMTRGAKSSELPSGIRQDTRKHTSHPLAPPEALVIGYLKKPTDEAWARYEIEYRALLETRFAADRAPYDALAAMARWHDVWIGCSCPTNKNPNVMHCHTVLALHFMKEKYPDLDVRFPEREK